MHRHLVIAAFIGSTAALAALPQISDQVATEIPGVVAAGTKVELVVSGLKGSDAGVSMPDGSLLFAEPDADRIMKVDPAGQVSTFLTDTNRTVGLAYDIKGRLIGTQTRNPAIAVMFPARQILADSFNGQPLVRPNDLVADSQGGIYFTDPIPNPRVAFREPPSGRKPLIFYLRPDGTLVSVADVAAPNGVQLSPDGKHFYAVDGPAIFVFDVVNGGILENRREFARHQSDGLAVDASGRLYATAAADGVAVFGPDGTRLGTIPVPVATQNLAFGGTDKKTLYVLGRGAVYRIRTLTPGIEGRAR